MTITNLGTHIKGDTFNEVIFTINQLVSGTTQPMDLTGASARMHFKLTPQSLAALEMTTANSKLAIIDATAGKLAIVKQVIDIAAGHYQFDLEVTLQSGDVYTVIAGELTIKQDITNG